MRPQFWSKMRSVAEGSGVDTGLGFVVRRFILADSNVFGKGPGRRIEPGLLDT